MRVAFATEHFYTAHAVTIILLGSHAVWRQRLPEARPAGAGIVLSLRIKQVRSAADALVDAFFFAVVIFASKCSLRALLPANGELRRGQLCFPLFIRFYDLVAHAVLLF